MTGSNRRFTTTRLKVFNSTYEASKYIGQQGEVVFDLEAKKFCIHDGISYGGVACLQASAPPVTLVNFGIVGHDLKVMMSDGSSFSVPLADLDGDNTYTGAHLNAGYLVLTKEDGTTTNLPLDQFDTDNTFVDVSVNGGNLDFTLEDGSHKYVPLVTLDTDNTIASAEINTSGQLVLRNEDNSVAAALNLPDKFLTAILATQNDTYTFTMSDGTNIQLAIDDNAIVSGGFDSYGVLKLQDKDGNIINCGTPKAYGTTINDAGNYYISSNVEGALQEIGNAIKPATATTSGTVELATTAEASGGTDNTRAVTPAGLSAALASSGFGDVIGAINIGTGSNVFKQKNGAHKLELRRIRGDGSILVSVVGDDVVIGGAPASTTQVGSVELATGQEAIDGTSSTLAVTPSALDSVLDSRCPNHATAVSAASDSTVGVIGNTGRYADEGHKHPIQLPSTDVNNGIITGPSDARHFLHDFRLNKVYNHGTSYDGCVYGGPLTGEANTGSDNTGYGHNVLNGGSTGDRNTAFGRGVLRNLSAASYDMTYFGAWAGYYATDTNSNAVFGAYAAYYNTTGDSICAFGKNSQRNATTAVGNSSFGRSSLEFLIDGNRNSAFGVNCLLNLIDGSNTAAFGRDSLGSLQHGDNNSSIGGHSGRYLNDGSELQTANNCVYFGYDTRALADNADNEIVIGFAARGHGNNTITLGNGNITDAHIQVAWTVTSDRRDKREIKPLTKGLDFIKSLNPVEYYFKVSRENEARNGRKRYGFIAQEVNDDVIVDATDSEHLRLTETAIIPVLVNAVKELTEKVNNLEKELSNARKG